MIELRARRWRWVGVLLVIAGLGLVALVEALQPVTGLGLYDGVVPEEPYRYVSPASGQAGSPASAQSTLDIANGNSPAIVLVTTEQPPQAQLIATPGSIAVLAGTTTITASVTPVAASAEQSAAANIYGNVYRYAVVDQDGNALGLAASAKPTIVLRAPFGSPSVTIAHWDGQQWQPIPTGLGATPSILTGPASTLGDYALIPGPAAISVPVLIGAGILVAGIAGVVVLVLRRPRRAHRGRGTQRKRGGDSA